MTAHEAFDAWWESPTRPASLSRESDLLAKESWLDACQWQREHDALTARSVSILADHEQPCCGEIPERMVKDAIAKTILYVPPRPA